MAFVDVAGLVIVVGVSFIAFRNTLPSQKNEQPAVSTTSPNETYGDCSPPENLRIRFPRFRPQCVHIEHVSQRTVRARLQPQGEKMEITVHPVNRIVDKAVASQTLICTKPNRDCIYSFTATNLVPDADYVLNIHELFGVRREAICHRPFSTTSEDHNLIRNPGFEDAGDSPYMPTRFSRSDSSHLRMWTPFYNGGVHIACGTTTVRDGEVIFPRSGRCCAQLGFRSPIDDEHAPVQKFYGMHQSVSLGHSKSSNVHIMGVWYRLSRDILNSELVGESPRDSLSMVVSWTWSDGRIDDGAVLQFDVTESAVHDWTLRCATISVPEGQSLDTMHISFHRHDFKLGSLFLDDVFLREVNRSDRENPQCTKLELQATDNVEEKSASRYEIHLRSLIRPKAKQLTLAVPCTPERVLRLEAMSRLYGGGPVVAAVLIKNDEDASLFTDVWRKRPWLTSHVDVRFVRMPPEMIANSSIPINALRNVALSLVRTEFVVMLDVDMTPATDAFACFREPTARYLSGLLPKGEKTLFILPVFVADQGQRSALNKSELLNQLGMRKGTTYCLNSQKPIRMWKWYTETEPYDVRFMAGFEPYGIGRMADYPRFDERFVGYGFNKIAWVLGAERAGFKLLVSTDAFVTHLNHIENDWVQSINVAHYLNTWRRYFSYVAQIS